MYGGVLGIEEENRVTDPGLGFVPGFWCVKGLAVQEKATPASGLLIESRMVHKTYLNSKCKFKVYSYFHVGFNYLMVYVTQTLTQL